MFKLAYNILNLNALFISTQRIDFFFYEAVILYHHASTEVPYGQTSNNYRRFSQW